MLLVFHKCNQNTVYYDRSTYNGNFNSILFLISFFIKVSTFQGVGVLVVHEKISFKRDVIYYMIYDKENQDNYKFFIFKNIANK